MDFLLSRKFWDTRDQQQLKSSLFREKEKRILGKRLDLTLVVDKKASVEYFQVALFIMQCKGAKMLRLWSRP